MRPLCPFPSFGDSYIYDNGGSSWNYDGPHKHGGYRFHTGDRHNKYWHLRFMHGPERPTNEKLDGLIKYLTRHSSRHNEPFQPKRCLHYNYIGR